MTQTEFIQRMIGVPWVNRACCLDACDCWGLVVLYYRYVRGIELHQIAGYEAGRDFLTCYQDEVVFWRQSDMPQDGGIFVGYVGSRAEHVGLIVDGGALHSRGDGGGVRFDRLRAVEKMFTRMEYLTYADYRNTARPGAA